MIVRKILDYIRQEEELDSDAAVAKHFGITRQAVDAWKSKDRLPKYVLAYYNKLLKVRGEAETIQYREENMEEENPVRLDKDESGKWIKTYTKTGESYILDSAQGVWVKMAEVEPS